MLSRTIFVTTDFVAFHRWLSAPDWCGYLKQSHRHLFKVKASVEVEHNDREVEFIDFKRQLADYTEQFENSSFSPHDYSCEDFAAIFIEWINSKYPNRPCSVECSEDGENGAVLDYIPDVLKEFLNDSR